MLGRLVLRGTKATRHPIFKEGPISSMVIRAFKANHPISKSRLHASSSTLPSRLNLANRISNTAYMDSRARFSRHSKASSLAFRLQRFSSLNIPSMTMDRVAILSGRLYRLTIKGTDSKPSPKAMVMSREGKAGNLSMRPMVQRLSRFIAKQVRAKLSKRLNLFMATIKHLSPTLSILRSTIRRASRFLQCKSSRR